MYWCLSSNVVACCMRLGAHLQCCVLAGDAKLIVWEQKEASPIRGMHSISLNASKVLLQGFPVLSFLLFQTPFLSTWLSTTLAQLSLASLPCWVYFRAFGPIHHLQRSSGTFSLVGFSLYLSTVNLFSWIILEKQRKKSHRPVQYTPHCPVQLLSREKKRHQLRPVQQLSFLWLSLPACTLNFYIGWIAVTCWDLN